MKHFALNFYYSWVGFLVVLLTCSIVVTLVILSAQRCEEIEGERVCRRCEPGYSGDDCNKLVKSYLTSLTFVATLTGQKGKMVV